MPAKVPFALANGMPAEGAARKTKKIRKGDVNLVARTTMQTGFSFALRSVALGLMCLAMSQPAHSGGLTRCDIARIAAHNAVLNKYGGLFSQLDEVIAQMQATRVDPTRLPYRDKDNKLQSANLVTLRAGLEKQEETDAGHADREAARACSDEEAQSEAIANRAEAIAVLGISTVLSQQMGNINWSQNPFELSEGSADSSR
jgi:hypothetical protein